jgi:putative DNA primase/helicase
MRPSDNRFEAVDAFRDAIANTGLTPPDQILGDGQLHRFSSNGRRGDDAGWYVLHQDRFVAGAFGCWRAGVSRSWCARGCQFSADERSQFDDLIRNARTAAEAARHAEQLAAAERARDRWHHGSPAQADHPYLTAKQVQPHASRQSGVLLLVPLVDPHGLLWNLQTIDGAGRKRFLRSGRVRGLFSPVGELGNPGTLLICEGWATAATLREETGQPVLAAVTAGNLLPVAEITRSHWLRADLVICADNDRATPNNPGLTKAREAANAVGARLAVPEFAAGETGRDFNDLANHRRARYG